MVSVLNARLVLGPQLKQLNAQLVLAPPLPLMEQLLLPTVKLVLALMTNVLNVLDLLKEIARNVMMVMLWLRANALNVKLALMQQLDQANAQLVLVPPLLMMALTNVKLVLEVMLDVSHAPQLVLINAQNALPVML